MSDRSKVGRGNRKIVRDWFRQFNIELPFGRDCVNGRYSFKASEGSRSSQNISGLYNHIRYAAALCPVPLEIVQTERPNSYTRAPQYNVAIRFEDK